MNRVRLHVVGLGVQQPAQLSDLVIETLNSASMVFGWARHEVLVSPFVERESFRCVLKLDELKAGIEDALSDSKVDSICVLASGDPLHYGIGQWLQKEYASRCELIFHPAVSSIQAACHKQGLSLQSVETLSLHGRPLSALRRALKQNKTLVILTDQHSHPKAIASECVNAGFPLSCIHVHECIGSPNELSRSFVAKELITSNEVFDPLHVTIIEMRGQSALTPQFPGFDDHLFETGAEPGKGMISKREVRLSILSFMQPAIGDVVWDIGAGCGGVSVELCYWQPELTLYAIEYHEERLGYLKENQRRFGVEQNLKVVEGKAPTSLEGLPTPNKIFIGGNDGELDNLLALAWEILPVNGLLVASGVIDKTKKGLRDFSNRLLKAQCAAVECIELSVKRSHRMVNEITMTQKLPVEIFRLQKTNATSINEVV